jgi:hypothetical protein
MTRRLTGTLTDASRDARPRAEPEIDPRLTALRRAVAGIATLAASPTFDASSPVEAQALGEAVLRVDASAKPLQAAAAALASASTAMSKGSAAEARTLLDRAATAIAALIRSDLAPAPRANVAELDRIGGALGDALKRGDSR